MRTIDCFSNAMKSISATDPDAVSNSVSRIIVPGQYRRVICCGASVGAMCQRPFSGEPSNAAKQAGLSKRGQHSQSIEPVLLTSAAVWQSPISA